MNNSSYPALAKKRLKILRVFGSYTFQNWSKEQADRYYKLIIQEIEYVAKDVHFQENPSNHCERTIE